jgi:hypothetical protein
MKINVTSSRWIPEMSEGSALPDEFKGTHSKNREEGEH